MSMQAEPMISLIDKVATGTSMALMETTWSRGRSVRGPKLRFLTTYIRA